ncbi:hypothetical protein J6P92_04270 [bacterium]|nr:hypothetical protein [bacterium]
MKAQAVSGQNFEGNIIFVDKVRTAPERMLERYLMQNLGGSNLNRLSKLVEDLPFDVFISRNEVRTNSLNISAGESFYDVLLGRCPQQYVVVKNNQEIPKQLGNIINAVRDVVNSYSKQLENRAKILEDIKNYSFTKFEQA